MRLKQQSFVDKYIEKIVLGVAVLIAAAIVYFYVLTPYTVEKAPGQRVSPDEIEKTYVEKARGLKRLVDSKEPPAELANLKIPDYVDRFIKRFGQPLSQSRSLYPIVYGPPGVRGAGGPGDENPGDIRPVEIVQPPAVKATTASLNHHVLESDDNLLATYTDQAQSQYPDEKESQVRALAGDWTKRAVAMAGQRDPRDFWAVGVSAEIHPQDWIKAIENVDPEKRYPESWYRDIVGYIADVELQRQTLDPKTGQWPADDKFETIPTLPGAVSVIIKDYLKQVQDAKNKKVDEVEALQLQQALLENLRYYIEDLAKPQFLPVKAHRPWQQPDQIVAELSPEDQQAIFRLNQQISRYEAELRALVGRTGTGNAGAGNAPPRLPTPYGPEGVIDPRTGLPKPGKTPPVRPPKTTTKTPATPASPDTTAKKAPNEERIAFYQAKLDDLYKQKEAVLAKLRKDDPTDPNNIDPSNPRLNPDPRNPIRRPDFTPEGPGPRPGTGNPPRRPGGPLDPRNPLEVAPAELPPIKLWAHDVTVQPGQTYRYRVVYRVINPLFNKEDRLVADQKPKAMALEQVSLPGQWTTPVTVEPELRYFVEEVRPETSTVTWGIYRIHNGYRIRGQFATRPGDPIGKSVDVDVKDDTGAVKGKEPVDMRVPAVLVDLKTPPKVAGAIGVRGPMTVLLADITDGKVRTRDPVADRNDADRMRLFNEASGTFTPPSTGTGTGAGGVPLNPNTVGIPGEGRIPVPPEGRIQR